MKVKEKVIRKSIAILEKKIAKIDALLNADPSGNTNKLIASKVKFDI